MRQIEESYEPTHWLPVLRRYFTVILLFTHMPSSRHRLGRVSSINLNHRATSVFPAPQRVRDVTAGEGFKYRFFKCAERGRCGA